MEKMKLDAPLDYAVFQLSPKRSRCELFVSSAGSREKLASGFLKPFVAHLKVAEEQFASGGQLIKLETGRRKNAEVWFTKGTLDRFVRFVSTPEILELVNTFDAEMSQLEAARRIYSQGAGDQLSGGSGSGSTAADDATKKELLRAIDVRLVAVEQDLTSTFARAAAAGFNVDTVSELQMFADRFGAYRLNEACGKFIALCERRPNLINQWKSCLDDRSVRSSCGSDMSIDEDPPSSPLRQNPRTCQQPNPPPATFPLHRTSSRESSVERDDGNRLSDAIGENLTTGETSAADQTGSVKASKHTRRLSVQDRISMFENKQKENSGEKPALAKSVELRRLSSDLSTMGTAAEKAVLRRWSGVSNMSIDMSAEKKDAEGPLGIPSLALTQENRVLNSDDDTSNSSSVNKPEFKDFRSLSRCSDSRLKEGSDKSEQILESSNPNSNLIAGENDGLKDQGLSKTLSKTSISKVDNQESSEEKFKTFPSDKSRNAFSFLDQRKLDSQSGEDLSETQSQIAGIKDQGSSLVQIRHIGRKGGAVDIPHPKEDTETKCVKQTSLKSSWKTVGESGVPEGDSHSRIREAFAARYKQIEGDSFSAKQESARDTGVVVEKESHFSENGSLSGVEDSGPWKLRHNQQGSAAELNKKAKVQLDGNSRTPFSGRITTDTQEDSDSFATLPPEQFERVRQSKGNQDLNDELKMKANELEKFYAEHKLRLPGDQSNSIHKGKLEDAQSKPVSSSKYSKTGLDISRQLSDKAKEPLGSSKNKTMFNSAASMETIYSQNDGYALDRSLSELSISEGSRGKLYHRYIQKRDAKLKEDWSFNRAEKEARLKFMQDSLERNRSDLKAKFSGSADRQDPVSSARRRAERLRSYNGRSNLNKEQKHFDFEDCDVDDEALDFGDGISKSAQGKKLIHNNRSLLSTTPRTSASTVPRSANKTSTGSARRRMQPENPLAQSVPNFSDLRKENTKPSSGGSKTARSQVRNHARSKSITEEVAIVKEEKPRRLQALKKSSANPSEFKEVPTLDSDGVALTPIKFDEEISESVGTKAFLKKGSRAGFVARTNIGRQRVSVGAEPVNNMDENDDIASEPFEYVSMINDEREEKFKTLNTEGHTHLEDLEPTLGLDSEKFVNSGSENGDDALTSSRVDQALGSQLPREIPTSFLPVESMQDSPSESPMSWSLQTQHPFSYPYEISDIDASVDSPVGSPSWSSHSFNQMEGDAARMRKKWGAAQKPMLGAHSSRKDMTRGFKRLLKFGRKNRGSETLVDWISATTSEGDDDTEDGRDLVNRYSEDFRKSRMGFSQAQPSDDNFNDNEFFNKSVQSSESSIPAPPTNFKLREDHISGTSIKAPKSFFSLSTFRSKGSESKLR